MDTNDLEEKIKSGLDKLKAKAFVSDDVEALSQMFDNIVDSNKSQLALIKDLKLTIKELEERKKELQSKLKTRRNED